MAKKRGQNEGSIRKRKDGKWEARVTVGINPNGSNRRKSLYGKTRQEVSIKMAEFLNDLHKGTLIDPTNKTVAEWLDEWMHDYKKLVLKPTSYINYMGYIDRQIVPMLGKYKLKDLRTDIVQKFIQDLVKLDLATGTIYGIVKVLKSAIKQAYINGMISKNVTYGVTMPKNEKIPRKAFTPEQQNIFLEAAKGGEHSEAFILSLFTGMRIGEVLALRWSDINFDKSYLEVNRTAVVIKDVDNPDSKWHTDFGTPKTQSSVRTIPLSPPAQKLLQKVKGEQEVLKLRLGTGYEDNDLVFTAGTGTPLNPRNMQKLFKRICETADLQGFTPHCLRHTFATLGYAQGIDIKVLQEILGHANINETANTYTHVDLDTIRQQMERMKLTADYGNDTTDETATAVL